VAPRSRQNACVSATASVRAGTTYATEVAPSRPASSSGTVAAAKSAAVSRALLPSPAATACSRLR
jgi:hypothetical protein